MSEMLANHYPLLRNYSYAQKLYERLNTNPRVFKKLIIYQTQTQKIEKVLIEFYKLISSERKITSNINIRVNDCRCIDLTFKIEDGEKKYITDELKFIVLGILCAYCSIKISMNYFKMALDKNPKNQIVKNVLSQIKNLIIKTNN